MAAWDRVRVRARVRVSVTLFGGGLDLDAHLGLHHGDLLHELLLFVLSLQGPNLSLQLELGLGLGLGLQAPHLSLRRHVRA